METICNKRFSRQTVFFLTEKVSYSYSPKYYPLFFVFPKKFSDICFTITTTTCFFVYLFKYSSQAEYLLIALCLKLYLKCTCLASYYLSSANWKSAHSTNYSYLRYQIRGRSKCQLLIRITIVLKRVFTQFLNSVRQELQLRHLCPRKTSPFRFLFL